MTKNELIAILQKIPNNPVIQIYSYDLGWFYDIDKITDTNEIAKNTKASSEIKSIIVIA